MKRTQIYLDEEQDARLAQEAQSAGRTKSDLIREAIDDYLRTRRRPLEHYKQAMRDAFGAAPYLPDGLTYVQELREVERTREQELERRWRQGQGGTRAPERGRER